MPARLSERFETAVLFAIQSHRGQTRKGSGAPYISHPLAVASLVLEYGGTENQAIAALLHDVIEDCGVHESTIARDFGKPVARIVRECSDYFGPKGHRKPPWRARKETYIAQLAKAGADTLLVSAADKLHNARAIVHAVRYLGESTWGRFSASPPEIAWYYRALLKAYRKRRAAGLRIILDELESWVSELGRLAEAARKRPRARGRSRSTKSA